MSITKSKTDILKTSEFELIKQYLELDAFGRPGILYTAPVFAKTGTPCLVTELKYVDDSSQLLLGKIEGYSVWNELFVPDSIFTTPDTTESKTHIIKTNEYELTKQYQEIDGQLRPSKIFEAPVFAKTGTPCKVTEYIYQNPTSTYIKGKKEGYAIWNEAWIPDVAFVVGV